VAILTEDGKRERYARSRHRSERFAALPFQPLAPPTGTPREVWVKKLIEILTHVYFRGEGVAYLLQRAIDAATKLERRPADAERRSCWLREYKAHGREGQWMDSTMRVIGTSATAT